LEAGAIVEQPASRISVSSIRQFAPKCRLVDGLPVCPQQQAFDAFAAAPGGTSSVSRGVFVSDGGRIVRRCGTAVRA
jgi:hypothetical protein